VGSGPRHVVGSNTTPIHKTDLDGGFAGRADGRGRMYIIEKGRTTLFEHIYRQRFITSAMRGKAWRNLKGREDPGEKILEEKGLKREWRTGFETMVILVMGR